MDNSLLNAFPYIFFVAFIGLWGTFEFRYKRSERLARFLLTSYMFLFLFFLGLRGYVGYDFYNYYMEFWQPLPILGDKSFWEIFLGNDMVDIGFRFYMLVIKNIWNNYSFFIFINALIDWLFIAYFLKRYTKYISISFVIFMVMGGLIFEIDFIRNFKSILLFVYSIKYIEKRRFLPFFLINLLGCSFHISALLYIPFYFLANRQINLRIYWCLFIGANILFICQIPFLRYILLPLANMMGGVVLFIIERYFNDFSTSYGLSIGYIERVSVALLCSYYYRSFTNNRLYLINANLLLYYLLLFFLFGEIRMVTLRLPYLFFFSYAVIIPLIYELMHKKLHRQIFLISIIIYSFLKIYGLTGLGMYQYENILFEHQTIEEREMQKKDIIIRH